MMKTDGVPKPYGAVPTPRQLAWHELEFCGFLHFTVNTFTDQEWGYGHEDPDLFHPSDFDADQIVETARMAGMRGLILTCKHHDGFCLWPAPGTKHSVANISWRKGKGNIVRDIARACERNGLRFGTYLSPWDRNHKDYARPAYVAYHRSEDERVRSPENLLDLYFKSVGRGASFLLNLPPDRRGQIHPHDVQSLRGFRRQLDAMFRVNLARRGKAAASQTRGNNPAFGPEQVLDGSRETYWTTDDDVTTPSLTLTFAQPVTFNVVSLREYLPLGQRVHGFGVDVWQAGRWRRFLAGESIGNRRLIRGERVATERVRLRITAAPVCPAISELGLHLHQASPRFSRTVMADAGVTEKHEDERNTDQRLL